MMLKMVPGCLVEVLGVNLGIAKLVSLDGPEAEVAWLRSVGHNIHDRYPCTRLVPADLRAGLRCFVTDEAERYWRCGHVAENRDSHPEDEDPVVLVRLAGASEAAPIRERDIWIRCELTPGDPTPALAAGVSESPYLHDRRSALLERLLRQRAASHGLTALLSANVRPLAHQVSVVRRVLQDPVQRYLLADEVGLGKTIEAGVVLRQLHIDDPQSRSLVLTPATLREQWRGELHDRFHLNADNHRLTLYSTTSTLPYWITKSRYDMVVVDEAHHVARDARVRERREVWQQVRTLCHEAPALLLLSATPALHNEADFLAMLHLLEPSTYPLDDVAAFARRVEGRQEIGRLLLQLRSGMLGMGLRSICGAIPRLLPADDWLQERVAELRECLAVSPLPRERADALVQAMRLHIGETHRIYRRLIRTRREDIPPAVLLPRAAHPQRPPVQVEPVRDERLPALAEQLEAWREGALAAVWRGERSEKGYAAVLRILVATSSGSLTSFRQALACRLWGGEVKDLSQTEARQLRAPSFPGEEDILREMMRLTGEKSRDGDQVDTVLELLRRVLREDGQRCVVFAGGHRVAREISNCLFRLDGPVTVLAHLAGTCRGGAGPEAGRNLREAPRPAVLVCDSSGEEGLNLQAADLIVMFDLPWDPDRLEQRLGRLDRLGNESEVQVRVLLPASGDEGTISLQEAWFRLLRDGLGLFSNSIADLQFLTPEVVEQASLAALREGSAGLLALASALPERVLHERNLLREQDILDAVRSVESEGDAEFLGTFLADDGNEASLQDAVEGWLVEALRFDGLDQTNRRVPWRQARGLDPVRYIAGERSDVTSEQADRVEAAQPRHGTWQRELSCSGSDLDLLRLGHPLLTLLQEGWAAEDRGRTYLMWRCCEELPPQTRLLFFRADYLLEASLDPVREVLDQEGYYLWSLRALRRRVDGWFPPRREVYHFDSNLQGVAAPDLHHLLARPYRRVRDGGGDVHLDAEGFSAIEALMSLDDWRELCLSMREQTEAAIRASAAFTETCRTAAAQADAEVARRMDQLARGLIYRGRIGHLPQGEQQGRQIVAEEQAVFAALVEGVSSPQLQLDAVGAIVLAGSPPKL